MLGLDHPPIKLGTLKTFGIHNRNRAFSSTIYQVAWGPTSTIYKMMYVDSDEFISTSFNTGIHCFISFCVPIKTVPSEVHLSIKILVSYFGLPKVQFNRKTVVWDHRWICLLDFSYLQPPAFILNKNTHKFQGKEADAWAKFHSFRCYIYAVTALNGMIICIILCQIPINGCSKNCSKNNLQYLCHVRVLHSHPKLTLTWRLNWSNHGIFSYDFAGNTLPLQSPKPTLYPSPCKIYQNNVESIQTLNPEP